MSDFAELSDMYQELILDHYKHPRNHRVLGACTHCAHGHNPLCGDRVDVYIKVDGDRIADITFDGSGCAISTASASLMTAQLKGHTLAEAREVFAKVHAMLTGHSDDEQVDLDSLGKLAALSHVCDYPVRVKCATLAWRTLEAALAGGAATISTDAKGAS